MAPSAATKATKASSSKKRGLEKKAPGKKRNTVPAATITPPSPPITPVKRNTRTSATPTKAREASTTFNEEDATSGEEVEDAGEQVISTRAEELARLTVEGEVVAIYDSIWTMEDTDTVKVFAGYQGETVVIKAIPSRLRSDTSKTYKAIYNAGPYEAVYSCEKGEGSKIFHNFTLDFANNAMLEDFSSDPLTFKFVDQLDRIWNDRAHCWIDTNPYLYLEVHVDRAMGHYFGSWAKRREHDDEEMDENNRTRLTSNDLDRLWMRKEINMQHPAWSRLDMNAPRWVRPWCGEIVASARPVPMMVSSFSSPFHTSTLESLVQIPTDSEPDGVVDAVYDVLWITGEAAPAYPYQKTGYTMTFKHVDTFTNPFRNIPVRRYKAYLNFLNCCSVYSCIRADYKSYRIFKLVQRNKQMKSVLKVKEAMSFDMLHGVLDENGFPLLKWRMNCSEENGIKKGDEGYVYRQGWAKRRASPDAPMAELSARERERLHEIDRLDGEYEALIG